MCTGVCHTNWEHISALSQSQDPIYNIKHQNIASTTTDSREETGEYKWVFAEDAMATTPWVANIQQWASIIMYSHGKKYHNPYLNSQECCAAQCKTQSERILALVYYSEEKSEATVNVTEVFSTSLANAATSWLCFGIFGEYPTARGHIYILPYAHSALYWL